MNRNDRKIAESARELVEAGMEIDAQAFENENWSTLIF